MIAIGVGGISNGSFPAPSKRLSRWKWEHIWLIYSFCAMGFLPISIAAFYDHGLILSILRNNATTTTKVAGFGLLFGLGSVLFGISLARLGIAITNALVSGVIIFLGSLGPLMIGTAHIDFRHLVWLISGLALLVVSLALCAGASLSRDRVRSPSSTELPSVTASFIAVFTAVAAGTFSSFLNVGFAFGTGLASAAKSQGCPSQLASLTIWVPALFGGLILNMGYPIYLLLRDKSWPLLFEGSHCGGYWLRSALMGLLWFSAILLYGYGASMMGSTGPVYGWALGSGSSILTSNTWGAIAGEWRGSGLTPKCLMLLSTALLLGSFVVLAAKRAPS
jgi:L-rhamnose-H+ transport protein